MISLRQFVERVADRELGGDLGDGKASRLRCQRRRARDARVHFDDDQASVLGIDGELHVGAAGIDPDLAQHRDRGVAHDLIFLVGQGQRRRHGDAVAGMHAHRIDVLDGADDDAIVGAVAHDLHLEFLPAQHRFLDQHFVAGRGPKTVLDDVLEFLAVIGDAAAGAAQGEGRADHGGQADIGKVRARLIERFHQLALGRLQADPVHRLAEQQPVLGLGDGVFFGADQFDIVAGEHAGLRQRHRGVERGLAAHGRQQRVGLFLGDDALDEIRRDRLDVGGIGHLRVGHDRRGIGIDQDDAIALFAQRLARLRPRIIELARLPDHDRPRADDQDRAYVGAFRHGPTRKTPTGGLKWRI